jgi:O-antigen/teichoic acid export membrane protein
LDRQKLFLINTCVGSTLRLLLLVALIPSFGFVGPSIAFVCAETVVVTLWMTQLARLGFSAHFFSVAWRPVIAGAAMGWLLYATRNVRFPDALLPAVLSLLAYGGLLLVLRTFSPEELQHAREGVNFVSPFITAWSKKINRT